MNIVMDVAIVSRLACAVSAIQFVPCIVPAGLPVAGFRATRTDRPPSNDQLGVFASNYCDC